MGEIVLHYFHDPLCGWCYAAEPLVRAAAFAGIPVVLHGGGLWDQPVHAPEAKRRMMRATDGRIADLTGQVFGAAYLDGLLVHPDTVWYSRPTIAAVLAAGQLQDAPDLAMLTAIQRAHYVNGRRVVEEPVLADIAGGIGLDPAAFTAARRAVDVDAHIRQTRMLMGRYDLRGFPSFLVQHGQAYVRLLHETLYGQPDAFVPALRGGYGA